MERIQAGGFTLLFEVNTDLAILIGFEGTDSTLKVPDSITVSGHDYLVTEVDKKAFLGCKGLRHVTLPPSVAKIGDWAFSQCIHLTSFLLPCPEPQRLSLGRGIFEGCLRLNYVSLKNTENPTEEDAAFLLGCVVTRLPAPYLLSPADVGLEGWFSGFDNALFQFIEQSDYADSDKNVLCGEEDIAYDDIASVDGELLGENAGYIQEVRKKKSYLCLMRLFHNSFLSKEKRTVFEEYIKQHSIGKGSSSAWQVIRDDFPDDKELLSLYLSVVSPDSEGIDAMLADLGNGHPQTKAQILNYQKSRPKQDSFFDDLFI